MMGDRVAHLREVGVAPVVVLGVFAVEEDAVELETVEAFGVGYGEGAPEKGVLSARASYSSAPKLYQSLAVVTL